VQFGVLTVGYGLPTGRENLLDGVLDVELVGSAIGESVNAGTERFGRTNGIRRV